LSFQVETLLNDSRVEYKAAGVRRRIENVVSVRATLRQEVRRGRDISVTSLPVKALALIAFYTRKIRVWRRQQKRGKLGERLFMRRSGFIAACKAGARGRPRWGHALFRDKEPGFSI
jgi:hypothetical protein